MFDYLPMSVKLYILTLAGFTGAMFGSAMNCLAYRMVHNQKWSGGRSACPHCGHVLKPYELIPVVSFLIQKGKCRACGAKLSLRYLATEALLGVCYVTLVLRFGFTLDTVTHLVLTTCLLALSLVDLDTQIIPHRFLVIPAALRIAHIALTGEWSALVPALIFGGGLLGLSLLMDKILKKDSMGGGDIKLMAVLGLFFTIPECLLLLILACFAGIVIASVLMKIKDDTPFPFGPALALAAYITMLAGETITGWYLSLF